VKLLTPVMNKDRQMPVEVVNFAPSHWNAVCEVMGGDPWRKNRQQKIVPITSADRA
jgi:hypothetical protein